MLRFYKCTLWQMVLLLQIPYYTYYHSIKLDFFSKEYHLCVHQYKQFNFIKSSMYFVGRPFCFCVCISCLNACANLILFLDSNALWNAHWRDFRFVFCQLPSKWLNHYFIYLLKGIHHVFAMQAHWVPIGLKLWYFPYIVFVIRYQYFTIQLLHTSIFDMPIMMRANFSSIFFP